MNTINIPGFTAEASLHRASAGYFAVSSMDQASNSIRPQFCDFECLTDCYFDCQDLPPRLRLGCLRRCRRTCCP
jgi:hypothetical protein